MAIYRLDGSEGGEESVRLPLDLEARSRVAPRGDGSGRQAFLSGQGLAFLELDAEGTTTLAVQAPPSSRFAFALHDGRTGTWWLRSNREVLAVDDRDGRVRGRHAFSQPGFQRRLFLGPEGGLLVRDDDRVLTLGPDGSVLAEQATPWRPTWLRTLGDPPVVLAGNGHPGDLKALRDGSEVTLSRDALERTVVQDGTGGVWFLEGQSRPNGVKDLVRVDPVTLETRRAGAPIYARRLFSGPEGRLVLHDADLRGEAVLALRPDGRQDLRLDLGRDDRLREVHLSPDGSKAWVLAHSLSSRVPGVTWRLLAFDLAHPGPPGDDGVPVVKPVEVGKAVSQVVIPAVLRDGRAVLFGERGADLFDPAAPGAQHFDDPAALVAALGDGAACDALRVPPDIPGAQAAPASFQDLLGEAAQRFGYPGGGGWRPLGPDHAYDPTDGCLVRRRDLGPAEAATLRQVQVDDLERQGDLRKGLLRARLYEHPSEFPGLPGLRLDTDPSAVRVVESDGTSRILVSSSRDHALATAIPVNCGGSPYVAAVEEGGMLYWADASPPPAGYARFHCPVPVLDFRVQDDRLLAFGGDGTVVVLRPALGEGRRLEGPAATRAPGPEVEGGPDRSIEEGCETVRIGDISLPRRQD